jgi:hypothetical protein
MMFPRKLGLLRHKRSQNEEEMILNRKKNLYLTLRANQKMFDEHF